MQYQSASFTQYCKSCSPETKVYGENRMGRNKVISKRNDLIDSSDDERAESVVK